MNIIMNFYPGATATQTIDTSGVAVSAPKGTSYVKPIDKVHVG